MRAVGDLNMFAFYGTGYTFNGGTVGASQELIIAGFAGCQPNEVVAQGYLDVTYEFIPDSTLYGIV
jgi:hypothetical protein